MAKTENAFRIGKVQGYLRGKIWYLCYHEEGRRRRPRVGPDRGAARQLATQINAQLQLGAPAALSFEPVGTTELRRRWLEHHEHVLRSSVQTVNRYRTATDHLLRFLETRPVRYASHFLPRHAEQFVYYLRLLSVSPNGHPHTAKRPLMDKGLRYVLECCRSLFNYAARRRHLSPYAENPFATLEIERVPIGVSRPITLFSPTQERAFLEACDDWQFPLFLTLMLTGVRPGELTHLLLPDDLDLGACVLRVRNKPGLGWQVKTRNEREIPLMPELSEVLRVYLDGRSTGPVFLRRRRAEQKSPDQRPDVPAAIELALARCVTDQQQELGRTLTRSEWGRLARHAWQELGTVEEGYIRTQFMRLTVTIGMPGCTAPKMLRHMFATSLQEGQVDPLIRNELMGHVAAGVKSAGYGLGMTAVYTHTRPETRRKQLETALAPRVAVAAARSWLNLRSDRTEK